MTRRDRSTWTSSRTTSCCRPRGPRRACPCSSRGPSAPATPRTTSSRWVGPGSPRVGMGCGEHSCTWGSILGPGSRDRKPRGPGGPGQGQAGRGLRCQPVPPHTHRGRASRRGPPRSPAWHTAPRVTLPPILPPPGSSPPGGVLERSLETRSPTLARLPTCSEAPGRPRPPLASVYPSVKCRAGGMTWKVCPALSRSSPLQRVPQASRAVPGPPLGRNDPPETLLHFAIVILSPLCCGSGTGRRYARGGGKCAGPWPLGAEPAARRCP